MLQRKAFSAATETLADRRQVRVICSTASVDRAGDIVVQDGIDLTNYKANPVVLWQHDGGTPVAKAVDIGVQNGQLMATCEFPPEGTSAKADEIYGLIKAGVVNAVSIGFNPLDAEPLDKANPKRGPQKYIKTELAEFSFVSVPANAGALIVARSLKGQQLKVGASLNLKIGRQKGHYAAPADPALLRKGGLIYDAAHPETVHVQFAALDLGDGRMKVVPERLATARADLAALSIPDEVAAKALAVIEHYEAKMAKAPRPLRVKDLYDVAQLAQLLQQLGYIEDFSEWEAEMEDDGSAVPQMLADALRVLSDAFLAMAQEEVAELIDEETGEPVEMATAALGRAIVKALGKIAKPNTAASSGGTTPDTGKALRLRRVKVLARHAAA